MEPQDVLLRVWLRTLTPEQVEWFDERSGILEFEAKRLRSEAERQAALLTAAHFGVPPPPSALAE